MNYAAAEKKESRTDLPYSISDQTRHWGMEAVWVKENGKLTCKWFSTNR